MDISLEGKVALITGGSRGIGLAIAKSYADSGAQVMLTSRKEESLRDAAKFVGGGASYLAGLSLIHI
jgi:NAD(P)-dependent dehydrogenase (short-subunit alcohol dehydrogenase family)